MRVSKGNEEEYMLHFFIMTNIVMSFPQRAAIREKRDEEMKKNSRARTKVVEQGLLGLDDKAIFAMDRGGTRNRNRK